LDGVYMVDHGHTVDKNLINRASPVSQSPLRVMRPHADNASEPGRGRRGDMAGVTRYFSPFPAQIGSIWITGD